MVDPARVAGFDYGFKCSVGSADSAPDAEIGHRVHLQKIYNSTATDAVERASRSDVVSISAFSALVEHGRQCTSALPDVRSGLIDNARQALESGDLASGTDIAASMINRAAEGQV